MKRFIATALVVASIGSANFALAASETVPLGLQQQIRALVPNADVDSLSSRQLAAIHGLFNRTGNDGSAAVEAGALKVILSWD